MKKIYSLLLIAAIAISFGFTIYPINGYKRTGIKRLYQIKKFHDDSIPYRRIPKGAYKTLEDIKLNLINVDDSVESLLTEDPEFAKKINRLFPGGNYSAAVMDVTNPNDLKYAAYRCY